jgi:ubiquinone/menaquinone biosynthesis C-methylase UbiE
MTKPRVPETDKGIQGQDNVAMYDQMQRNQNKRGWGISGQLVQYGMIHGSALEIGHGPGYVGLEWLRATSGTRLTGVDISPDMTRLAVKNAAEYGLTDRTEYKTGKGDHLPFEDNTFNLVFTNGSLHEWANPLGTFREIQRVLRPGGSYFISDLRRDMNILIQWFMGTQVKPAIIRPYLFSSIHAAYTPQELSKMARDADLIDATVTPNMIGHVLWGKKQ